METRIATSCRSSMSWPPDAARLRVHGVSMVSDALLALGVLLTTATQLRLASMPIGPGELCLLIWIIVTFARVLSRLSFPLTSALSRLMLFWAVFAFSLSVGFLTGLFIGELYDWGWFLHDAMAYPLLALVSCLSLVGPEARLRLRRVAWLLIILGTASLALQVAAGWELIDVPLIHPWFGERFRGWSANPNQIALLCAALGLMSLDLAETATRFIGRIVAISCLILPIYVGRMTMSDTFTLALVMSGPFFIALKLFSVLKRRAPLLPSARRSAAQFAWVIVLGLPLLLGSLLPFAVVAQSDAWIVAKDLSKNGGQKLSQEADLRFSLWTEAIEVGVDSAMLGLGPGPHLKIPEEIVEDRLNLPDHPDYIKHPEHEFAPNFESHNTFLELLTQGGTIAVLSFVWILFTSAFTAYTARRAGLATLICGLGIFCMTGVASRNPILWLSIALCLVQRVDRVKAMGVQN
jgi:hypothetical protein